MAYQMTKDLETGNTLIDTEHRQLFDAINCWRPAPRGRAAKRWKRQGAF